MRMCVRLEDINAPRSPAGQTVSQPATPARTTTGPRLRWTGPMCSLAVLMFALVASPAMAASTGAGGESREVSASLDFRIVIPETLHIDSMPERRRKSLAFVSRTTQTRDGLTVVTVARP